MTIEQALAEIEALKRKLAEAEKERDRVTADASRKKAAAVDAAVAMVRTEFAGKTPSIAALSQEFRAFSASMEQKLAAIEGKA